MCLTWGLLRGMVLLIGIAFVILDWCDNSHPCNIDPLKLHGSGV